MRRKKISIFILIAAYVLSYVAFRITHTEIWEKDRKEYVIFPKGQLWVYYIYRPLSYLDGKLTAINFHIGPHQ